MVNSGFLRVQRAFEQRLVRGQLAGVFGHAVVWPAATTSLLVVDRSCEELALLTVGLLNYYFLSLCPWERANWEVPTMQNWSIPIASDPGVLAMIVFILEVR
jgi:hypothetical protein